MPRVRPKTPGSGRVAGTPNKITTELRDAAQKYTPAALQVLQSIMCNAKNPAAARVAAAAELLNRGHGKPHQTQDIAVSETQHYVRAGPQMDRAEWDLFLQYKRNEKPLETAPLKFANLLATSPELDAFKRSQQAKLIEAKAKPINGKSTPSIQ